MEAETSISSPFWKKIFEVVNNVTGAMMIDRAGFLSLCQGLIFIINYKNNLLMFS